MFYLNIYKLREEEEELFLSYKIGDTLEKIKEVPIEIYGLASNTKYIVKVFEDETELAKDDETLLTQQGNYDPYDMEDGFRLFLDNESEFSGYYLYQGNNIVNDANIDGEDLYYQIRNAGSGEGEFILIDKFPLNIYDVLEDNQYIVVYKGIPQDQQSYDEHTLAISETKFSSQEIDISKTI